MLPSAAQGWLFGLCALPPNRKLRFPSWQIRWSLRLQGCCLCSTVAVLPVRARPSRKHRRKEGAKSVWITFSEPLPPPPPPPLLPTGGQADLGGAEESKGKERTTKTNSSSELCQLQSLSGIQTERFIIDRRSPPLPPPKPNLLRHLHFQSIPSVISIAPAIHYQSALSPTKNRVSFVLSCAGHMFVPAASVASH